MYSDGIDSRHLAFIELMMLALRGRLEVVSEQNKAESEQESIQYVSNLFDNLKSKGEIK